MDNMALLHGRMSRHVVTVKVGVIRPYAIYDGIVLSSNLDCLYIIASSELIGKIDNNVIRVQLPNHEWIVIEKNCFDIADQDVGIIGIRCMNPTPGVAFGFENLEPIEISEDPVQEGQTVFTYSRHFKMKLLTPGSIMLVEGESFDQSCARYLNTHKGAPVVNTVGQLVGFTFSHNGYLTSYNLREVAARIQMIQGREPKSIAVTFQHLRQQCQAIGVRLCGPVVQCKIQRIGQPVDSASWKNLEEFRRQHPTFQVEQEIEEEIEQQRAAKRFKGRCYVRQGRQ